jgi:hypothetical protein
MPINTPSPALVLAATALLMSACATPPAATPPASAAAASAAPAPAASPAAAAGSGIAPAAPAAAATTPGRAAPPTPAAAPQGPAAAAPAAPGTPPPFATVIKDARKVEGPLVLWQKDDKVWIEIGANQFGQPFLLSPKIKTGIAEAFVIGGLMSYPVSGAGGQQIVEFVRVHNTVRLQARNTDVFAKAGTPEARAVESSFAASLLGSAPVASQAHPDSKAVLIEANGIFLSDMLGVGMMLQRGFRQNYALDGRNTVITTVRGTPAATILESQHHFYSTTLAVPAPGTPPGAPVPVLPKFVPDARSLLVGLHYSLAPLPAVPMATRVADPRVGLFDTTVLDFSDDLSRTPRSRMVNRWRLEKKEPAAAVSDPVKPITFWIDRNVPLAYRDTVRSAILEWNKAFERVGISNALVVEQQPDDATFDTLDFGINAVRWMMSPEPAFGAIGPRHIDPRTGEILQSVIGFEGMSSRSTRTVRSRVLAPHAAGVAGTDAAMPSFAVPFGWPTAAHATHDPAVCQHAEVAAEQLNYAIDLLDARGDLDPDSPLAQQFVLDYIKDVTMHEVGHSLGLRHNFRASRIYTQAQLADPEFTRVNGTTGSVMEYNAINLPLPGQPGGTPFQTALGPYDYWAIEFAYRPMAPGTTPEAERAELQRIASRSNEPLLAFGTDEDSALGIDPETIQLDLGDDPVAFAAKRIAIARDLFVRQETRFLPPDRDYAALRRSLNFAVNDMGRAVGVLARQIGGVRTLRDFPNSGRDPLQPVPAAVQRQALDLIAKAVLVTDGLSVSPALQRRLAPDFLDRGDTPGVGTEFSVEQRLLELQRAVIGQLMSEVVARRLLDSVSRYDKPTEAFHLSELYARLTRDVWSELASGKPITAARRDLQREHVNRLSAGLLKPVNARADGRGLLRAQSVELLSKIDAALSRGTAKDAETRAHLLDSADSLRQALTAPLVRTGV